MTDGQDTADQLEPIYANIVSMNVGAFDFTMTFGYQSPEDREASEAKGPGRFKPVARIAMSQGHAKSMLPILARLIASFEESQGTIPAPGFDGDTKG